MSAPARRMLSRQEAADYCGFKSVNGFESYIQVRPVKFGGMVRYDRADLDAYLDRLRESPSGKSFSEAAGDAGENRGHPALQG